MSYQQLLAATDAIGNVSRAHTGQLQRLLQPALHEILGALELGDGAVYLNIPRLDELALVAEAVPGGQPAPTYDRAGLARRAAATRAAVSITSQLGGPASVLAMPLLAGARLLGVILVAGMAEQPLDAARSQLLADLAGRLSSAIDHAQAANAAHSEQERTRALVDASNDAILMLDSHGAATMINRRAKYFFGLAERDVIGRSAGQLRAMFRLIFEDSAAFDAWITPLLASSEERAVIELKVLRAEPRLLQCFSAPVLDHQERLLGRMLVFRDITREREVEQMKTDFVSIVSHELRTPLTSIRGSLQLVLGRPQQPELAPRTRELLEISLKNSERLIRLINDILDISKIEQGSIQLRRVAIDPSDLCRTAAQEVESFAASRDIAIDARVPEGLPPISADRDRALQILTNLLSNAIKFSDAGQRVELTALLGNDAITFAVRDHGRGIAPEDHQRIFEKFHQIDSSLTRNVGGTGLGLAICKALVEEHGGNIWIESTLGHGAAFSFSMPLASNSSPVVATRNDPNQPVVLVADDSEAARGLLREMLESAGYQVAEAAGGAAAVQLARFLQPKLLTLDVMMPDLDGFDVIQVLRNDPLTRDLPVLFISATVEHERGLALGGSGFMTKPFTAEQLLAEVRRLTRAPIRRVLVMEDDYHVRPTLARLLQRGGFQVEQAEDGRSGLEQIERNPPDLVLLDIWMPDVNGFEVLRRLKEHPLHRNIPVVVLTASDVNGEAHQRALALGAVRYLEKPIASEELLAEIERVLA
jgi:PAS domain S-box-containing protein